MITPLDVQNKEFSRVVRGYKEEEVDEFLDLITVDLEKLITNNAALKEQVASLQKDLSKYKASETAVLDTLEAAKALMGDISASAEKRAEILLKNAELDAQLIQREAKEEADRLAEENVQLRSRFIEFRSKYKTLLESELEKFDTLSEELFREFADSEGTDLFGEERISSGADTDSDLSKTRVHVKIDE